MIRQVALVTSVSGLLWQSVTIDEWFLYGYRLIMHRLINNNDRYQLTNLSIDVDWSIGFPIIDFHRLNTPGVIPLTPKMTLGKYLQGYVTRYLLTFSKRLNLSLPQSSFKKMVLSCYLSWSVIGIGTVSCRLVQRKARMDKDWSLKRLGQLFQGLTLPCQNHPKNY